MYHFKFGTFVAPYSKAVAVCYHRHLQPIERHPGGVICLSPLGDGHLPEVRKKLNPTHELPPAIG